MIIGFVIIRFRDNNWDRNYCVLKQIIINTILKWFLIYQRYYYNSTFRYAFSIIWPILLQQISLSLLILILVSFFIHNIPRLDGLTD